MEHVVGSIWRAGCWMQPPINCMWWVLGSVSNGSGLPGFGAVLNQTKIPGLGQEPPSNPNRVTSARLLPGPDINPQLFGQVLPTAEPHFRKHITWAPIKYFSSDCITIWYIRKRCTFACCFTFFCPICALIDIGWVAVQWCRKLFVFHSDSTNIDQISNQRTGGEGACKSASVMYISYCDTIRTQILNCS